MGIDGGLLPRRGPPPVPMQAVNAYVCTTGVDNLDATLKKVGELGTMVVVPKMAVPGVGWLAYAPTPKAIFSACCNRMRRPSELGTQLPGQLSATLSVTAATDRICAAIAGEGYAVEAGFLPQATIAALAGEARARDAAGEFHPAGVGRGTARHAAKRRTRRSHPVARSKLGRPGFSNRSGGR